MPRRIPTRSAWIILTLGCCTAPLLAVQSATQSPRTNDAATRPAKSRLPEGFGTKSLTVSDGEVYKYVVFIPPAYEREPDRKWPVLLYLHGSGQIGDDGIKQARRGLPRTISNNVDGFPMIVVMPQAHSMWFHGKNAEAAWGALEAVSREYRCDLDRVYLTGVSMGGFAAWDFAMTHPDAFAAIVPICGVGAKEFVSNILHTPVWAFHSAEDPNVPVSGSREPIAELRRLGAEPKYTEYAGRKHNCWDRAYATPELWEWLLAQRRPPPPGGIDFLLPAAPTSAVARVWWFAFKTAEGANGAAHVRAEIAEDGTITVLTKGIEGWIIESNADPLKPGRQIAVTWNNVPVMKGAFTGRIAVEYKPKSPATAPQPAQSRPAEDPAH